MGVTGSAPAEEENTGLVPDGVLQQATRQFERSASLGGRFFSGRLEGGRDIAVKVLQNSSGHDVKAFANRATLLCGIQPHPHLALPCGWSQTESQSFIVYDLVHGETAAKRLEASRSPDGPAFRWEERLRLAAATASGLSYLRSSTKGGLHLNLRLSSIFFDRTGQVKLADFGIEGEGVASEASKSSPRQLESQKTEAEGAGLCALQVAEMRDFGRLLLDLLLSDSSPAVAATAAVTCGEQEPQKPLLRQLRRSGDCKSDEETLCLLREVLLSPLDPSADWPPNLAGAVAEVALTCASAKEVGSSPPPGMASIAGRLLQLCIEQRSGAPLEGSEAAGALAKKLFAVFECAYSSQVDVKTLPQENKRLVLKPGEVPWRVGRQYQLETFLRLVPDQNLSGCIARAHFELWPDGKSCEEKPLLRLRPLSDNPLVVDGLPVLVGPSGPEEVLLKSGSQVSFCRMDKVFLTLQLSLKLSQDVALGTGSQGTACGSSATSEFALVCEHLTGGNADDLSLEIRTIFLDSTGLTSVGRQHQPGFFERLLPAVHKDRCVHCVSRKHFDIVPLPGGGPPSQQRFEVRNSSSNPIGLGGSVLKEGGKRALQVGETIDFIAEDASGELVVYLRLGLRWLGASMSSEDPERCDAPSSVPFVLYLSGTAVQKEFPQSQRAVEGSRHGLTIGRAHQRGLHEKAFLDGVVGFISRDHFSIQQATDQDTFQLVPLSQNPIWHLRDGRQQRLMSEDAPVPLKDKDEVLLFTGAEDLSAEGAGSSGTVRWVFRVTSVVEKPPAVEKKESADILLRSESTQEISV
eukprot:TRINITY_DN33023_c0_g1_i1.p1 TRINITY_DN33023_c0_g1~~TRINITY_DN33023_c0_g1_i1.p1  ORF type:complete len:805 (+),score=188.07 TRINITY_DN33023_c0_g1_i1:77-2491(+)